MTTKPGSLSPEALEILVAAGIPIATASPASNTVSANCKLSGTSRMIPNQSSAVAADAQVPGPGLIKPVQKNVAASFAQRGACEQVRRLPSVAIAQLDCPPLLALVFIELIRIRSGRVVGDISNGGGNYVLTACPLSQIKQSAALAAVRKLGVGAFDRLLAYWAAEFDRALAGHNPYFRWLSKRRGSTLSFRQSSRRGHSRGIRRSHNDKTAPTRAPTPQEFRSQTPCRRFPAHALRYGLPGAVHFHRKDPRAAGQIVCPPATSFSAGLSFFGFASGACDGARFPGPAPFAPGQR